MAKTFIAPVSLLVGTTIGAGIFSLPYVFSKSGLWLGLIYLLILSLASFVIHLLYADIVVRTYDGHHRFPGYAKIYLGKYGEIFANFVIFTTLLLMLTVYLILSVSFTSLIFPQIPEYFKIFVFWILGSTAILFGIKKEALFESLTTFITLAIILVIFIFGFFGDFSKINFSSFINLKFALLPLGPVLFSLIGQTAIPPIVVYFKNEELEISQIKKIIFWGTILPAIFYFLFILGIFGLSGNISQDAVSGLINHVNPIFLILLGVFGFISLWDSYASIGTDIKKILNYDWSLSKITASLVAIFVPLILYLLGLKNFLGLIGFVGGIMLSLWALLIIIIWKKASCTYCQQKILGTINPVIIYTVTFILIGALIYQIKTFF